MVISSMRCLFHFLMPHFSFRSMLSFRELYQHEGSSSIDVSALVVKSTRREVDVKYGDKATTTGLLRDTHGRANPYRCNYQRLRCVELSFRFLAIVSPNFPQENSRDQFSLSRIFASAKRGCYLKILLGN